MNGDVDYWEELAACRDSGLEFVDVLQTKDAIPLVRRFCDRCEVQDECISAANALPVRPWGIWGGRLYANANRQPLDLRLDSIRGGAA